MAGPADRHHQVYRATFTYDQKTQTWTGFVAEVEACSVRASTLDDAKWYLREALAAILGVPSTNGLALHEFVIDPPADERARDSA